MSNLNGRLNRIEQQIAPVFSWLVVKQDLHDPDLFRDVTGNAYGRSELPERVILIEYDPDWRGED